MTQRDRQKPGRTAAPRATSRGARTAAAKAAKSPVDPIEKLELERNELLTRLAAAEARIERLESQRLDVLNRIDWAIDSIHNVLERET
jgi:hypothetical protein